MIKPSAIILASLAILAGIANGAMDILQFKYSQSFAAEWNAEYWNPDKSWRYKYARTKINTLVPAPDTWYYRTFGLKYKERYLFSATALSFTTDAWHLAKLISYGSIRAIVVYLLLYLLSLYRTRLWGIRPMWYFLPLWLLLTSIQSLGFHIIYSFI